MRVCDPTYSEANLRRAGITLHEMPYPDGHSPPDDVLDRWLKLVDERFVHPTNVPVPSYTSGGSNDDAGVGDGATSGAARNSPTGTPNTLLLGSNGSTVHTVDTHNISSTSNHAGPTIAVHCVAGLGRAPVLVAIALIEFAKMEPVDAATFIRKHRRGAINNIQLDWLERYKRRYKSSAGNGCCVVM